ncbi:hypothetical protein Tco_1471540 [Tanacetum coccineum]
MAALKFANSHNMVAFLDKPTKSDGFKQIMDFLNAHPIKYALTVNPTIYTSCIEKFWSTAKVKTINGEVLIQALVDKKKVIIAETSIRSDLQLEDAEGTECLPNATIFEQLTLMGEKTFLTPTINQPSPSQPQKKQNPRKSKKQNTKVSQPSDSTEPIADEAPNDENVTTHSNDGLIDKEVTILFQKVGLNYSTFILFT